MRKLTQLYWLKANLEKPRKKKGCQAYFISPYDPRLPHPREIISKNYELLARNPKAKALFPRQNLVAASRRLKNLGEILREMRLSRGALAEGEAESKGGEEEEWLGLMDSHPWAAACWRPSPPNEWVLPLSVSSKNWEV